MDQNLLRQREAKCIQEEPPGCTTTCPVHVDVRGIVDAIKKNDYGKGYSLFQKMVPFPRIISRICDQICQRGCKRKEIDEPIAINALEKVCVDNMGQHIAKPKTIKAKKDKIAVIGAGLSGLTVAIELAKKGYQVVIYEATGRLGGSIWDISEEKLPRQLIEDDLFELKNNPFIEIIFNTPISNEKQSAPTFDSICADFSAVYLGIGSNGVHSLNLGLDGDEKGNIVINPLTLQTSHPKVFAGGSLYLGKERKSPITSISHGKMAVNSIDRQLQKASLTANRDKEGSYPTLLYTNIKGIKPQEAVKCSDPTRGYTREEALKEAQRCLMCECLECVKVCEYLAHYRSYPKRYVREVYNNLSIVMGIRHANKMINSCSLCGLCEEVCPNGLNMGEIYQEARRIMVKKGKMPPSAHDFALRDMAFSTGEKFILNKNQPGFASSSVVFFPGCQLSGSSPQYVREIYDYLCEKIEGGVGLSLGCCGAPADWAGREEHFSETLRDIENRWLELGQPKIITACPTCYSIFKERLPQIELDYIWNVFEQYGLPPIDEEKIEPKRLVIHDACTTRHEDSLHESIRNILHKLGHEIQELGNSRQTTGCCGYGGLMMFANRELAQQVVDRRINESQADYLVYCAMCRDNFVAQGKRTYHLLDLIFGRDKPDRANQLGPDFSQRHENRARCKATFLKEIWGENVVEDKTDIKLFIPEEVRKILDDRRILIEDITKVIQYAEETGNRLKDTKTGRYIAYFKPVAVTYWVEYSPQEEGFLVHNAYSHRLEIN